MNTPSEDLQDDLVTVLVLMDQVAAARKLAEEARQKAEACEQTFRDIQRSAMEALSEFHVALDKYRVSSGCADAALIPDVAALCGICGKPVLSGGHIHPTCAAREIEKLVDRKVEGPIEYGANTGNLYEARTPSKIYEVVILVIRQRPHGEPRTYFGPVSAGSTAEAIAKYRDRLYDRQEMSPADWFLFAAATPMGENDWTQTEVSSVA